MKNPRHNEASYTQHGMKYLYCNHAINKMMYQLVSAATKLS